MTGSRQLGGLTAVSAVADWRQQAACRDEDPELFFPPPGGRMAQHMRQARAICAQCPVRADCLKFALDVEADSGRKSRHGIFAGTTPRQRWAMWRCTNGRCEHPQHKRELTRNREDQ